MSKRNRRHRRTRAKAKVATRNLAHSVALQSLASEMRSKARGSGPVHICGSRSPSDGLTPLQREAVREASALQHLRAQTEIQHSHMVIQEPFGWTVHTYNPQLPEHRFEDSRIQEVDDYTRSNRYSRKLRDEREAAEQERQQQLAKLRLQHSIRDRIRNTILEGE